MRPHCHGLETAPAPASTPVGSTRRRAETPLPLTPRSMERMRDGVTRHDVAVRFHPLLPFLSLAPSGKIEALQQLRARTTTVGGMRSPAVGIERVRRGDECVQSTRRNTTWAAASPMSTCWEIGGSTQPTLSADVTDSAVASGRTSGIYVWKVERSRPFLSIGSTTRVRCSRVDMTASGASGMCESGRTGGTSRFMPAPIRREGVVARGSGWATRKRSWRSRLSPSRGRRSG